MVPHWTSSSLLLVYDKVILYFPTFLLSMLIYSHKLFRLHHRAPTLILIFHLLGPSWSRICYLQMIVYWWAVFLYEMLSDLGGFWMITIWPWGWGWIPANPPSTLVQRQGPIWDTWLEICWGLNSRVAPGNTWGFLFFDKGWQGQNVLGWNRWLWAFRGLID